MPAVFAAVDSARLQWETRPALYATRTEKMLRTSLPTAPLSLQRGNAYFVVAMSCYIPIPANSAMSSWGLRTKNKLFVFCPVFVKLMHSYLSIILLISAPFWVTPNLWRSKRQRRSPLFKGYFQKLMRRVFQGKLFLLAYDLISSNKPFRSKTPRKPLCLYLKTADKVTDLLLRSGRTPKLSVSGNLRNT